MSRLRPRPASFAGRTKNTSAWRRLKGRALYSFNVGDYHEIHREWTATGRGHAGIILAQQKRYSTGEQIRRLLRLIGSLTDDEMRNREEFLVGGERARAY